MNEKNIYSPINQNDQEKEQKNTKNRQIKLTIIGIAILVIGLVGITYAFFNYIRTGTANVIKVGRISFNSLQGPSINLTNVFPIDREDIDNETDYVGSVTINVTGSTDYSEGVEYLISTTDVNSLTGSIYLSEMKIPISIDVDYSANGNGKTIGIENNNYFNDGVRGGDTSYYKVLAKNSIRNNSAIVVGYIAPNETGIDGNIVIRAFIDKDRIGISDTYPERDYYRVNPNISSGAINNCVSYMTSIELDQYLKTGETMSDFCAGTGTLDGTPFQEWLDIGEFDNEDINFFLGHGVIIFGGINGTGNDWAKGRVILTTDTWNNVQQNGLSFKVKVEANEGVWVNDPGKIESCPGCKFLFNDEVDYYTTWNTEGETPSVITSGLSDSYLDIVDNQGKNHFLGVVLNNDNQVTRAFVCGVKNDIPFCVEGTKEGASYVDKVSLLQGSSLWNNTCEPYVYGEGTADEYDGLECYGEPYIDIHDHGCIILGSSNYDYTYVNCGVEDTGMFGCHTYD